MISEREAMEMLGRSVVGEYHKRMWDYRKENGCVKPEKTVWDSYVSLPFLMKEFDFGPEQLPVGLGNPAIVLIHPGFGSYGDHARSLANDKKEEYGDYDEEYFGPLKRRIHEAKSEGQRIIVYAPRDELEPTVGITGEQDVMFVPTFRTDTDIDRSVIGVDTVDLIGMLKEYGVEDIELCGEWVGACFDTAKRVFESYGRLGRGRFNVTDSIRYPVRGSYKSDVLFSMTKEEGMELDRTMEELEEWQSRTYKRYMSELGLKRETCTAKALKELVDFVGDERIYMCAMYMTCKNHSKEEVEKSVEFLQDAGLLRVEKREDVLSDDIRTESHIRFGSEIERLQSFNRLLKGQGLPTSNDVIIPLIECELLK